MNKSNVIRIFGVDLVRFHDDDEEEEQPNHTHQDTLQPKKLYHQEIFMAELSTQECDQKKRKVIDHSSSTTVSKGKENILDDKELADVDAIQEEPIDVPVSLITEGVVINEKNKKQKFSEKNIPKKNDNSSKKNKPKVSHVPAALIPPPIMIKEDINQKGGSEPVFLFQKVLETSDLKDNLNRLFITQSEKLMEALTDEEKRVVEDEANKIGFVISTVDTDGRTYKLNLKKWKSVQMCVLNKEWKKFYKANNLQKEDHVQGWGYRTRDSEFCLVLTTGKNAQGVEPNEDHIMNTESSSSGIGSSSNTIMQ